MLGIIALSDVYNELKDAILSEHEHLSISCEKELTRYAMNEIAPQEVFNIIAQCYMDVGMKNKAIETHKKCKKWLEKYSIE